MKRISRTRLRSMIALLALWALPATLAQSSPGQGLLGLGDSTFANDVELRAAVANQQTFDVLDAECNPGGVLDRVANPTDSPSASCVGDVFSIYLTIRELVHTANDLLGVGPNVASLGLDQEGLGAALRWTAAEEFAAQGSAATEFSNSQLSNLAARVNALRFGARGFSVAGLYHPAMRDDVRVAQATYGRRGGGASADDATFSRWGGFINGSFGYGNKEDTDLENAFDFDSSEITLGVDYRFDNGIVLGGMVGWTQQTIDFDEAASAIRVVDGGMESDGTSLIAFGLYQGEKTFVSASLGFGSLDYDAERQIKYGSNNPDIGASNSIALSKPKADTATATLNAGYAWNVGRLIVEPQFNLEYLDVSIDAFSEQRSITPLGMVDDDAFNLNISDQTIESLETSIGVRLQYTFTPSIGVIVPFAKVFLHREFESDPREILAGYGALDGSGLFAGGAPLQFAVPTDAIDDSFITFGAGVSTVLRGGRQRDFNGPVTGGLMGFMQYESTQGIDNYEQTVVSVGVRYEF